MQTEQINLIHKKLDSLKDDIAELKADVAIVNDWKRQTRIYIYSLWLVILGFVVKKIGL